MAMAVGDTANLFAREEKHFAFFIIGRLAIRNERWRKCPEKSAPSIVRFMPDGNESDNVEIAVFISIGFSNISIKLAVSTFRGISNSDANLSASRTTGFLDSFACSPPFNGRSR